MRYSEPQTDWPFDLTEADRQAQNLAHYCELMGLTLLCVIVPTQQIIDAEERKDPKGTPVHNSTHVHQRVDVALNIASQRFVTAAVDQARKRRKN